MLGVSPIHPPDPVGPPHSERPPEDDGSRQGGIVRGRPASSDAANTSGYRIPFSSTTPISCKVPQSGTAKVFTSVLAR